MSKKLKNYTDPLDLMDSISADAFRYYLLSSPVVLGEDINLLDKDVLGAERKLVMVYNVLDFFLTYVSVDRWQVDKSVPKPEHILDRWILSKLQGLIKEVSSQMEEYNLMHAARPILEFVDDLSNWYVRRSRKRFWKSENDDDKQKAYHTLYFILLELSKLMAPFTPFMAEDVYQQITNSPESVHLQDFPIYQVELVHSKLEQEMSHVRFCITEGLALRAKAGIKVRQPLLAAQLRQDVSFGPEYDAVLAEELNVKEVQHEKIKDFNAKKSILENIEERGVPQPEWIKLDFRLTPELKREGHMREVIRFVQNARKEAGLNVDDRIQLELKTDDTELQKAIEEHLDTIKTETLTTNYKPVKDGFETSVKVEAHPLSISLKKHV